MSDKPITMAEMEILMSKMMSTAAKKHDIERIEEKMSVAINGVRAEVALCTERLGGCDNTSDKMEARMMALEDRVNSAATRPSRSSTSSARSGSWTTATGGARAWWTFEFGPPSGRARRRS